MKFNQITVNTEHKETVDSTQVFMSEERAFMAESVYCQIMYNNGTLTKVPGGTYATGSMEEDYYAIFLCNEDGIPLMVTAGAINMLGFAKMEADLKSLYRRAFDEDISLDWNEVPIVCDMILPGCRLQPKIFSWTKDFCRCMGTTAFRLMETRILFEKFAEECLPDIWKDLIEKE